VGGKSLIGLMLLAGSLAGGNDFLIQGRDLEPFSDVELLREAEENYRIGLEYRHDSRQALPYFYQSIRCYEALWQRGHHHPRLAQNLAQAYLISDRIAEAITTYRKGLLLDPFDSGLRQGLRLAREKVLYPNEGELSRNAQLPDQWSPFYLVPLFVVHILVVGLSLTTLFFFTQAWFKRESTFWIWGGGCLIVTIGVVIWMRFEETSWEEDRQRAEIVIASERTNLHTGNNAVFPQRIREPLPVGLEAKFLAERGDWVQIELANGIVGWVSSNRILRIGIPN
jgi:hypothetical protein